MKKYDIVIAVAYIIIIFAIYMLIGKKSREVEVIKNKSIAITDCQSIKALVVTNTASNFEICPLDQDAPESVNWVINAHISELHIDQIVISGDTLYIDGQNGLSVDGVIKLRSSIDVEIINSPNVSLLTDEEFAIKRAEKPSKYDF